MLLYDEISCVYFLLFTITYAYLKLFRCHTGAYRYVFDLPYEALLYLKINILNFGLYDTCITHNFVVSKKSFNFQIFF